MKVRILTTLGFAVCLGGVVLGQQSSPLTAARDLYASARYDEALTVLDGMTMGAAGLDRRSIEQYRSLCLLALGRGTEAESAIAAVVTADPLFVPGESEASPRVRGAFSEVRQRLLPEIAASRYTAAKAAFDRKDFVTAEAAFRELMALLEDRQMGNRLTDLRVLAAGFLDLSAAAAAPPPEPVKPTPAVAEGPKAPVLDPGHIWNGEEAGVTVPTAIKQDVPRVPSSITTQMRDRGMLEIIIDEQGRVTSIVLRSSVHPIYDPLLMGAARQWRYSPATVGGVPVKFRKLVQITVSR